MTDGQDICFDSLEYAKIKDNARDTDWYAIKDVKAYWTLMIKPIQKKDLVGIPRCYMGVINAGYTKDDVLKAIYFYSRSDWHIKNQMWKTLRGFLNAQMVQVWMNNRKPVNHGRTAQHIISNI